MYYMELNWKAIIAAFIITTVLSIIFGLYLPKNVDLIGPVIGGLIAGYLVGGSYTDGLVNGGIPAGIGGIVSTVTIVLLSSSQITSLVYSIGYTGSKESLFLGLIVGAAIAGFALFFVFGIIGSIIGVKLSKNKTSKSD
jgi:energy-coupling factor transporter transmembrane protein EcfT